MADMTVRAAQMDAALANLRDMLSRVQTRFAQSGYDSAKAILVDAVFGWVKGWVESATEVTQTQDSVQTAIRIAGQGIDLLSGATRSDAWGNLYQRSLTDDDVFQFWGEYAQSIGESLATALDLSSYDISVFIGRVGTQIKSDAKGYASTGETGFYWLFALAGIVLLIVILK